MTTFNIDVPINQKEKVDSQKKQSVGINEWIFRDFFASLLIMFSCLSTFINVIFAA